MCVWFLCLCQVCLYNFLCMCVIFVFVPVSVCFAIIYVCMCVCVCQCASVCVRVCFSPCIPTHMGASDTLLRATVLWFPSAPDTTLQVPHASYIGSIDGKASRPKRHKS